MGFYGNEWLEDNWKKKAFEVLSEPIIAKNKKAAHKTVFDFIQKHGRW